MYFNDLAAFSAVDLFISGHENPGFYDSQREGTAGIVKSVFPATRDILGTVCATIRTSSASAKVPAPGAGLKRYVQVTLAESREVTDGIFEAHTILRSVPALKKGGILLQNIPLIFRTLTSDLLLHSMKH